MLDNAIQHTSIKSHIFLKNLKILIFVLLNHIIAKVHHFILKIKTKLKIEFLNLILFYKLDT